VTGLSRNFSTFRQHCQHFFVDNRRADVVPAGFEYGAKLRPLVAMFALKKSARNEAPFT
jgi:hypothetical protein